MEINKNTTIAIIFITVSIATIFEPLAALGFVGAFIVGLALCD